MNYLVSYDLNTPGKNYEAVYDAIEKASDGTWCRPLESVYIISSSLTAQAIYDRVSAHIDLNDNLLVIEVTANASWYLDTDLGNYLKKML